MYITLDVAATTIIVPESSSNLSTTSLIIELDQFLGRTNPKPRIDNPQLAQLLASERSTNLEAGLSSWARLLYDSFSFDCLGLRAHTISGQQSIQFPRLGDQALVLLPTNITLRADYLLAPVLSLPDYSLEFDVSALRAELSQSAVSYFARLRDKLGGNTFENHSASREISMPQKNSQDLDQPRKSSFVSVRIADIQFSATNVLKLAVRGAQLTAASSAVKTNISVDLESVVVDSMIGPPFPLLQAGPIDGNQVRGDLDATASAMVAKLHL